MVSEKDQENYVGCAAVIWQLVVTSPMWLVLLFAMMSQKDMPVYAWVLYWAYVPAHVVGVLMAGLVRLLLAAKQ